MIMEGNKILKSREFSGRHHLKWMEQLNSGKCALDNSVYSLSGLYVRDLGSEGGGSDWSSSNVLLNIPKYFFYSKFRYSVVHRMPTFYSNLQASSDVCTAKI